MTAIYSTGGAGDPSGGELSDTELDAVLFAADTELLEHVRRCVHSEAALIAMMGSEDAPPGPAGLVRRPAQKPGAARALDVIEMRAIARRLHDILTRARDGYKAIALALYTALALPTYLENACSATCRLLDDAEDRRARAAGSCAARLALTGKHPPDSRFALLRFVSWVTTSSPARYWPISPGWTAGASARRSRRHVRRAERDVSVAMASGLCLAAVEQGKGLARTAGITIGQLGECRFDRLIERVRDPLTFLAIELDRIDLATLAEDRTAICTHARELADRASLHSTATDISARSAVLAGSLGCLDSEAGDRLTKALPRILCEVAEFAEFAEAGSSRAAGPKRAQKAFYQLNYLSEAIVTGYLDAKAVVAAIDLALLQYPGLSLTEIEVDASGADISEVRVPDLDVLDGVTWTDDTNWPCGLTPAVRARSDVIYPGVYKVRDSDRDHHLPIGRFALAHRLA